MTRWLTVGLQCLFFGLFSTDLLAAGGPLAQGFDGDDWMEKIHVVLTVVGLVLTTTLVLIFFILRKKD